MIHFKSNALAGGPAAEAGISIPRFDLSLLGVAELLSSPRPTRQRGPGLGQLRISLRRVPSAARLEPP